MEKLNIDTLKTVTTDLSNLESKIDKLDVDTLVPVPVDLIKLSDAVKRFVIKKDLYNAKIKNIEDKISGITNLAGNTEITNLATNTTLSTRINEIKIKIPWSTEFLRPYILLFLKKK